MENPTTEFKIWENETPVIIFPGDSEFKVWDNDAPVEDQVTTGTTPPVPPVVVSRRRFSIY